MQSIAETGMFENLKEKMANPIMFTYFWVFCSGNIQNIFYLLYMPLKIDQKFLDLSGKWSFLTPLMVSIFIVLTWFNRFDYPS